ncbi:hypothetical protein A1359_19775 [Methylomonas lenta]|uniref:Pilus assembly protein PilW n=1 Tax=Methylomonas lenta TaxID=980561 RepID=A0A177NSZ4_9GAMM|nr:PilW family protein [Methylomonas lenta]OAI21156.1 hypothetical protein A1359_19775 [Methylomonas lenta]
MNTPTLKAISLKEVYDGLIDTNTTYDILTCQSMDELDSTIKLSLHPIHCPQQSSFNRQRRQQGMTLIEIMIALVIGAFLLGGVLQIFVNSKQTYRMQENLSRMQENGRFAMEFLEHDLRMAGFWGCLAPSSPNNTDVAGTNNDNSSADIDDGTDTITVRGAFVQTTTGNCGSTVDTTASYYTHATSTIGYRIKTSVLERTDNGGNYQDLIEGIEDMQILYGADTDTNGTPDYYVEAGTVGLDMAQVVSVRINLTARTLENNLTSTGDGRLRRNFTSTIAIRNRLQ